MHSIIDNKLYEDLERKGISTFAHDRDNNSFLLVEREESTKKILARYRENGCTKVTTPSGLDYYGISSKDAYQASFLNLLSDPTVNIVVCFGDAGTGKTTLALAYALHAHERDGMKLCLSKPTALVGKGKTFGAIPGNVREKFAPHVASYQIIMNSLTKGKGGKYFEMMEAKGDLEFVPVEYVRGNNYENSVFILDEAQNLDWSELKTVASRINDSSKLIVLADLNQIDTGTPSHLTGVSQLINSPTFRASSLSASVQLMKQYRGPIPDLIHKVDMDIRSVSKR